MYYLASVGIGKFTTKTEMQIFAKYQSQEPGQGQETTDGSGSFYNEYLMIQHRLLGDGDQ